VSIIPIPYSDFTTRNFFRDVISYSSLSLSQFCPSFTPNTLPSHAKYNEVQRLWKHMILGVGAPPAKQSKPFPANGKGDLSSEESHTANWNLFRLDFLLCHFLIPLLPEMSLIFKGKNVSEVNVLTYQ
jgi:hypothetical protein